MAIRPWPEHWTGHVYIQDVQRAAHKSCGDLLFSSHTIFMLTGESLRVCVCVCECVRVRAPMCMCVDGRASVFF